MHNLHYWTVEIQSIIRNERFEHQFGINLWAKLLGGRLIGPLGLPARLYGEIYLESLQ